MTVSDQNGRRPGLTATGARASTVQLTRSPAPNVTERTTLAAHRTSAGRFRYRPPWSLIVGPAVTLAMMLWGVTAPAYWGDEADTVSAVSRSLPQLLRMLQHVDAVHGLYYLSLWPVARVLGTGEFATRLPSALAMAAAALGIAAIARRLVSARVALYAGLLFALFPMVSAQGHDARPYGMVTAAAVLASYVMIRAVDDPRRRWFAAYGVSLMLLGYLELFGLLLILAHGVTVAGLRRSGRPPAPGPVARRWLVTVLAAVIATVPLVAYGWQQRAQIAWIARPGWHDALSAVTSLAAGSTTLAVVVWLLAVLGGMLGGTPALPLRAGLAQVAGRGPGPPGTGRALTWLAVPWLAVPPAMLLAASQIKPVYNFRYLVFCLPAMALLAGAGLAVLARGEHSVSPGASPRTRRPGAPRWPKGPRDSVTGTLATNPRGHSACPGANPRSPSVGAEVGRAGRRPRPDRGARGADAAQHPGSRHRYADRLAVPGHPRAAGRRRHLPGGWRPALVPRLPGRPGAAAGYLDGRVGPGVGPAVRDTGHGAGADPA